MRNSYLESYYNILPKIQQDRLLEILKKQYDESGMTPDDSILRNRLEQLIAELKDPLGEPMVQYRKAEKYSKISSKNYNNTMEEVFVDLGALFKQNNTISRVVKDHKLLNDAVLRDVRAALIKVKNDVMVYKVIKENKTGITDAKYNTFYKDDNQSIDPVYKAWVDTETDSVKLPIGMDHSSVSINGVPMADIELYHYGGGIRGTLEKEDHRKERAIDDSDETFWGEVILTDEPVRQIYDNTTRFGTICEIIIKLFRAELVNYIRYKPFCNYPLTISSIYYKEGENSSWNNLNITEITSTETMEFNFSSQMMKEVKIVINQKNPSINTYKIPKRIINNAQLWQQIADREASISTSTDIPIQATQDMIDTVTGWQAYVDALEKYKDRLKEIGTPEKTDSLTETIVDSATDVITETAKSGADTITMDLYNKKSDINDELIEVRKYEYTYGAYDINIKRLWFLGDGEYISPKYEVNSPVMEAVLDATETLASGVTIEYQVATRDNEWRNILSASGYITKERLDLDPLTRIGYLRFPATGSPTAVYRNDEALPSNDYTYTASTSEIVVGSGWYVQGAIFTTSYEPKGTSDAIPSGTMVSFANDALLSANESVIGGTSRERKVTLRHVPYADYEIINDTSDANKTSPNFTYNRGRWQNTSGAPKYEVATNGYYDVMIATIDGYSTENKTDYYEDENPALVSYNAVSFPDYQYLHSGKNVYFNSNLDNKEINVEYDYLNDYIQFRAFLRNNSLGNVTTTPVLHDYTLKLRTI